MRVTCKALGIAAGAIMLLGLVGGSPAPAGATTPSGCASQLTSVKAELKKAAAGPKVDAARQHYKAAAAAHKKNDDVTCVAELNAAEAALK
jgi:hypothetical protein